MTSEEDDLLLGAEAKSVAHQNFEENNCSGITMNIERRLDMTGKAGKSSRDDDAAEDEKQTRLQNGLAHQESQNSEHSVSVNNSLNEILEERKGDPEMILQNLGFSGSYSDVNCRIPDRFLLTPSNAYGISVEKFLDGNPKLREFLEEKNAIQNPFEMMMTASAEVPVEKHRRARTSSGSFYQAVLTVTMVNRFKRLIGKGCWASLIRGGVPVAEAVVQETPRGCRYWSVLPDDNRNYLERSGFYDELWSSVSVACDPPEESKPTSFGAAERRTAESKNPKLLGVACDLMSTQLHKGQEEEHSNTSTKHNLMFPWSKPNVSSSSVYKAEGRPQLTPDMHIEGNGPPQFQPQLNAKSIPGRFLANTSALVPNHLMTFSESRIDLDMHQSMLEDSSAMIRVGMEVSESAGLKNELPTTESLYEEHNGNIMQSASNCNVEIGDCTHQENRIIGSFRDAIAVSTTMDSDASATSELSQTLIDSASHDRCLSPSGFTTCETDCVCQGQKFLEPHDSSGTMLSVCSGDSECTGGCVGMADSDGLELSSAAETHSDAVAALSSYDSLHCRLAARKERLPLRDFRAFSIDVADTYSSNDSKMAASIFNGQSRLKDDLIHQVSIQSDSSGFTEGDQLDVSLLSIHDALAPPNRLMNMETRRLKDTGCGQCFAYSVCQSPDFMNSRCAQRPFSEGNDHFFHMFSEPSCMIPHCTTSTQTDSFDISSSSPNRCFSAQNNVSQGVATHHGFQQNLLNNGAPSKVGRINTTMSDNVCVSINDRSGVSADCVMSGGNALKQYRTEVTILVNQSSMKLQNVETSRVISPSSAHNLMRLNEDIAPSFSLETDVVNKRNYRNHASESFRLDQSSPVKDFGLSRIAAYSLDGQKSESVMSGRSSPVRYRSKSVSFQPNQQSLPVRDLNQTIRLKNSCDLQESYNWIGRVQSSPSSHDSGSTSLFYESYDECFLDLSEYQMLQDRLEDSGFVNPQSLPSFFQPLNRPTIPVASTPKWKQCVRDELKLMDFALRKYKLQNKLLRRRMCKAINSSGCNSHPAGVLLHDERDDLDMLEILHTEIMEELDKMEELLMQRLKRFLRSHGYEEDEHLPLSDLTSQCILHSMNQLLYEQDYQSNIVNSINCSTGPNDHLSSSSSPLLPSSPPPLLLHSVPIVSLQQLSKCLASVETLLSDIQRKTDVIEKNSSPCQQPVQKFLDQNKELKRRKSYHRFLPACLKPQWPRKRPVLKQQMSLPNIKEDR